MSEKQLIQKNCRLYSMPAFAAAGIRPDWRTEMIQKNNKNDLRIQKTEQAIKNALEKAKK